MPIVGNRYSYLCTHIVYAKISTEDVLIVLVNSDTSECINKKAFLLFLILLQKFGIWIQSLFGTEIVGQTVYENHETLLFWISLQDFEDC